MPIRPLNLPQDFQVALDIVKDAFRYPDHPEWETTSEQDVNYADQIKSLSRWWFLLRIINFFSPNTMDHYRGFIWEEDHRPVGVVTGFLHGAGRWEIGFLAVLPQFRGRRIAQQLLAGMLDFIRQRDGKIVTLLVFDGNLPAIKLYEQVGFVQYLTETSFVHPAELPLKETETVFPGGYSLEPVRFRNSKPVYELDRRITPDVVVRYRPIEMDCYQSPLLQELFFTWMGRLSGIVFKEVLVYHGKDVVAYGGHESRTRPGGTNYIYIRSDPSHPEIAHQLMSYLLHCVQKNSPGREIRFKLTDWQKSEIEAAQLLGCKTAGRQYLCLGLVL